MKDVFDITLKLEDGIDAGSLRPASQPIAIFLEPAKGGFLDARDSKDSLGAAEARYWPCGSTVKGEIEIIPHIDIKVSEIGYDIVREAKGRMAPEKDLILTEHLAGQMQLNTGEKYVFPVTIQHQGIETYRGENLNIHFKFELFLSFDDENRKKLFKQFSIKKLFSDRTYRESTPIFFRDTTFRYEVLAEEIVLKPKIGGIGLTIALSVGAGIVASFLVDWGVIQVSGAIIGAGSVLALMLGYLAYRRELGKTVVEVDRDGENGIKVFLRNDQNWRFVNQVKTQLEVVERVTDTRGTSDSIHRATLYESGEKATSSPTREVENRFEWPKKSLPASMTRGEVAILWKIVVRVKGLLGIGVKFEAIFSVNRLGMVES